MSSAGSFIFSISFPVIALAGAAIQLAVENRPRTTERVLEILLVWILSVALGVGLILGALAHLFRPEQVAESIGWQTSPFQRENAFGGLAFGVLGVLCIWLRGNFWDAMVIGSSISLLGDAYGHIYELVVHNNHAPGNAGVILYTDIIVPVVAIILLILLRSAQHRQGSQVI
jgi:hypothetical protein